MRTIIIAALCLSALASKLAAVDATNLVTYQSLSGTNATASYDPNYTASAPSPFSMKPQTFLIQHGGIPTTNTLTVNIQLSVDKTNFFTVATYRPSITNAGLYTYTPRISTNRFYIRASVVTTNATSVGVTATAP